MPSRNSTAPVATTINRISLFLCSVLLSGFTLASPCTTLPNLSPQPGDWQGWGNGLANQRFAPQGINSADLDSLALRWAYGFEGTSSVVGNPVVQGNTVFIGVDSGMVYALDLDSGCEYWTYQAASGVRTAPALGQIAGQWQLYFGDSKAQVYRLEASTGTLQWLTKVETHQAAILTGSPQFVHLDIAHQADRLLVPVSSSEEGIAAVPTYPCCTFRGSVVSLDAATGEQIWRTYTIANPPHATEENRFGPSGGAIWSAPTVDLAHNRLYVTTGDAYSSPADIGTDAVIGMDLLNGKILWINQGTSDDIWTVVCMTPNARDDCGPDQDYGSPGMLVDSQGQQVLVTGQKSGIVRAFSLPGGSLLWQRALVANTTEFGGKVVWGGGSDNRRVYFGLGSGGIAAVNLNTTAIDWFTPFNPAPDLSQHPGQDGPLLISADLVISGGWDGMLRILDSNTGQALWSYNTVQTYQTVNGVPASGGSMGAAGPMISGKRLLVPSGYIGVKNGIKGNALLMFSPR